MTVCLQKLSYFQKVSYGSGHVLNDLTSSMWFSYFLIFLNQVVEFESKTAGYMLLIGQVADALSTILIGFLSDKVTHGFWNYGKRKSWHLLGVLCVSISFPFSFQLCTLCKYILVDSYEQTQFVYYLILVIVFQFGWAASQISHLSLIPDLTNDETQRVSLNTIRYASNVISCLFVYTITYFLLSIKTFDPNSSATRLTRSDSNKFMYLGVIITILGVLFQVLFHLGVKEKRVNKINQVDVKPPALPQVVIDDFKDMSAASVHQVDDYKDEWLKHLKRSRFYVVCLLYTTTRLIINLGQIYIPMYLTDAIRLNKTYIALIPFLCYSSGFVSTWPISKFTKVFGSCWACFFGIFMVTICSVLFWFHELIHDTSTNSIVAAIILGAGITAISVSSLSIITELIGNKSSSGAFVFGTMSFSDKISSGIAVVILEELNPCKLDKETLLCANFYSNIMSTLPLIFSFITILALAYLYVDKRCEKGK